MVKLITYNFNGSRKKLASILSAATRDHVDAIFGQEMHYNDVGHFDLVKSARTMGWDAYANPATKDDPSGGTAIFIRITSQTIVRTSDAPGPAVRGWHAVAKARGSSPRSYEVFFGRGQN